MNSKILAIFAPLLLLSACAGDPAPTFGVTPVQVPELPTELDRKYEALPPIEDPSLVGQVRAGIEGDRAYNDVSHRYNNFVDFYKCVRDAVNNQSDVAACLGVEEEDEGL